MRVRVRWDELVMMPPGAAASRAAQKATLAGMLARITLLLKWGCSLIVCMQCASPCHLVQEHPLMGCCAL